MSNEQVMFRSKRPQRILQEAFGFLVAYNAVRAVMADAAREAAVRPIRLSFLNSLRRVRWALFDSAEHAYRNLIDRLASCLLPPRRSDRVCDRAVKIKMSNYPRKRVGKRSAPSRYQRQARERQWRRGEVP